MRRCFPPLALFGAFLCLHLSLGAQEIVRVGGTGAGLGGLQVLAKAFEQEHPQRRIKILPSVGSSGGIRAVTDGLLDVSCSSRPLHADEKGPGLIETPWVTTGFIFATQASSPSESLTLPEIEDIYAGRRTHWKDGRPIRLVLRPKADTAHAFLAGLSPGMAVALDRAHNLPGVCIGVTDQEAATFLQTTPGSFGTAVLGLVQSEGRSIQALRLNGLLPTDRAYPYSVSLSLVHRPTTASPATLAFLGFARSKKGLHLLSKVGYQPFLVTQPAKQR